MLSTALTLIVAACGSDAGTSVISSQEEVFFVTEDGVRIAATLRVPERSRPGGVLLVHALGADHHSWDLFAARLQQRGYMSLAIDLRGHGGSTRKDGASLVFEQFSAGDWAVAVNDLDAGKSYLIQRGADARSFSLVGASLGANLALRYAATHEDVQALVLLSPGLEYKGIRAEPALADYGKRPLLLLTTEGDSYSASTCTRLKAKAPGFSELREYPGAAHGTDILDVSTNAIEQILQWLDAVVGRT
ncbi:MAG: alpha/beta hydrolase [Candidatus Hydrogenedentes bacterium]|nr:alpha/beta hydrolase [Candidatus Hydrogenedentota bacterium]